MTTKTHRYRLTFTIPAAPSRPERPWTLDIFAPTLDQAIFTARTSLSRFFNVERDKLELRTIEILKLQPRKTPR